MAAPVLIHFEFRAVLLLYTCVGVPIASSCYAAGRTNLVIYKSVNTLLCLTLKTLIYPFGFASFVMTKSDRTQRCSQNLIQLTVCLMQPLSVTWLHKLETQRSKSCRILLYPFLAKVVYDRVLNYVSIYELLHD